MYRVAVVLNLIVIMYFAGFWHYISAASDFIDTQAHEFSVKQTIALSHELMANREKLLAMPHTITIYDEKEKSLMREELQLYRDDPSAMVTGTIERWEQQKRTHAAIPYLVAHPRSCRHSFVEDFQNTHTKLMADLHFFAKSNFYVGCLAMLFVFRTSNDLRNPLLWCSILLFTTVLFSCFMYIDATKVFRILSQMHIGLWYPMSLAVILLFALIFERIFVMRTSDTSSTSEPQNAVHHAADP